MEQTNGIKYFSGVDPWGGVFGGAHTPPWGGVFGGAHTPHGVGFLEGRTPP